MFAGQAAGTPPIPKIEDPTTKDGVTIQSVGHCPTLFLKRAPYIFEDQRSILLI